LLVRVGPEALSDLVRREGVAPMVKGGRTSKGWVHVDPAVVAGTSELAAWIGRAKDVVRNVERP
jgi:hypothetical protein